MTKHDDEEDESLSPTQQNEQNSHTIWIFRVLSSWRTTKITYTELLPCGKVLASIIISQAEISGIVY